MSVKEIYIADGVTAGMVVTGDKEKAECKSVYLDYYVVFFLKKIAT